MATRVILAFDRVNKTLVPLEGSASTLPFFYQRDDLPLLIKVVEPNGNPPGLDPYDVKTDAELGGAPRVRLASQVTGTTGDEDQFALAELDETGMTWDGALQGFTGTLNLNTTQMAEYIGAASSKTVIFEVRLATSGAYETLWQNSGAIVRANAHESGVAPLDIINGAPVHDQVYLRDLNDPTDPGKYLVLTNVDGVLTTQLNS